MSATIEGSGVRARQLLPEPPRAIARLSGLIFLAAVALGIVVRAIPVLSTDFPLNDGGLFSVMSRDLRENGFLLPAFTSYNGGTIPFGYPPLGLYLNAMLGPLFPGIEGGLRFLPLIITCLTVPAFFFMVRSWVPASTAAIATFAFAIIPRSWMWQVAGGGITRSLGMLFAFLAIGCAMRLLQTGERRCWILAPLLAGATLLSHLEAFAFGAATLALVWIFQDRSSRSLRRLLIVALLAMIVASPWLVTVIATHGLGPLIAAGGSRLAFMNIALAILVSLRWTAEPYVEVGAILGIIGLGLTVASGRWWLAVWIVVIFAVLPGGAATYAMVPWALLIAVAIIQLSAMAPARRVLPVVAVLLVVAIGASTWARYLYLNPLTSLPAVQREAMAWAGANTPRDSRFVVISGAYWPVDATAEWFPALSNQQSANTVQGKEFTSPAEWERAVLASGQLDDCVTGSAQCLMDWSDTWNVPFDYVFIPRGRVPGVEAVECCGPLASALATDPRFRTIAELDGAWVYQRVR